MLKEVLAAWSIFAACLLVAVIAVLALAYLGEPQSVWLMELFQ